MDTKSKSNNYYEKYLKYKNKYLELKTQFGGVSTSYSDLILKLKDAITNENIVLTEEELKLLELTDGELEKLKISRKQYEELKINCKGLHRYKLQNQISDNYIFADDETNKLNLQCDKIANVENFKLKKLELQNPQIDVKSTKQRIEGIDKLPGSLFQLLELFHRLPYEIQIFITKNVDGTIGLYLIKGKLTHTDTVRRQLCGINIHTHHYHLPQRKTDVKYWPPSSDDISFALESIRQKMNIKNTTFKLSDIKYDYVFDGHNLWYHKSNIPMINKIISQNKNMNRIMKLLNELRNIFEINRILYEIRFQIDQKTPNLTYDKVLESLINEKNNLEKKFIEVEEDQLNLLDVIRSNTDTNAFQLVGVKTDDFRLEQINLEQYIDQMNNLVNQKGHVSDEELIGMDIGLIPESEFKNKKSVNIPDSLTCEIKERIENHIVLPETGLLNNEELELLYKKALGILEKQEDSKKLKMSPF